MAKKFSERSESEIGGVLEFLAGLLIGSA